MQGLWILASNLKDYLELCHGNTCLKIFVVVVPKEGLAGPYPEVQCQYTGSFEPCHGNTCLKTFVVVIPKEGLAPPTNPFFGMTPTTDYNL